MIAQTNIQLYGQLLRQSFDPMELRRFRAGYDLACQLFANRFRPTGKPFVCHLVGVASTLLHWNQPPEMALAGLLHSAYLYGDFGDRGDQVTEARQKIVQSTIGVDAEQLVLGYTNAKGVALADIDATDVQILILADIYDEVFDCGPGFATGKPIAELKDPTAVAASIELTRRLVGQSPAAQLQSMIEQSKCTEIPEVFQRSERGSYRVATGLPELKPVKRRWFSSSLKKRFRKDA